MMKQYFLTVCTALTLCLGSSVHAQNAFVTIWNTSHPGTSDSSQIILPITGFFYDIAWEEVGNAANNGSLTGDFDFTTITFPAPGVYRVSIEQGFGFISSFELDDGGDEQKIIDVEQWGTIQWFNMFSSFSNCDSLKVISATDVPNLDGASTISYMFSGCDSLQHINHLNAWDLGAVSNLNGVFSHCYVFDQDIGDWDVSGVTSLSYLFEFCEIFNQDLSDWDIGNVVEMIGTFYGARKFNQDIEMWSPGNVTAMDYLFSEADSFNQDISTWNTENVSTMSYMFFGADAFDQDIGGWDVSRVISMYQMFFNAESFDQDIGDWDVGLVKNMDGMFGLASSFNQDIGGWDVSSVTDMRSMFAFATSFDQDISDWEVGNVVYMSEMFRGVPLFNPDIRNWNVESVTSMEMMFDMATTFNQPLGGWQLREGVNLNGMLDNSGMDCASYSSTLIGWAGNPNTPDNLSLGADSIEFATGAIAARNALIGKGWAISDQGENPSCDFDPDPFVSIWDTDKSGVSTNTQIQIPALGSNFDIEWEEVGNPVNSGMLSGNGTTLLNFPATGVYFVRITDGNGSFNGLNFNNSGDLLKLVEVLQWGVADWTDLEAAFYGCGNLKVSAVDVLPLSGVTSTKYLFRACDSLNKVPNISAWDTELVTDMEGMFLNASVYNQSLSSMSVGYVENMRSMFEGATLFNAKIDGWDVSNVLDMGRMFFTASAFDQPLDSWNTAAVENMEYMFYQALSFDQILGSWDLGALNALVSPMDSMLSFSGMSCPSYSFTLRSWADSTSTPDDIILGADGISYSPDAASAHNVLTTSKNWTITDAGEDSTCILFSDKFITIWQSNNPGSSDLDEVEFPGTGTNYLIEWEDYNDTGINGSLTGT